MSELILRLKPFQQYIHLYFMYNQIPPQMKRIIYFYYYYLYDVHETVQHNMYIIQGMNKIIKLQN